MGNIHEVAEQVEHAAHAAHEGHGEGEGHGDSHGPATHGGQKSIAKYVGLTMATLGVLLALCSALVGGQRTELTQSMVRQANTYSEYQASSTKYRVLMVQIEQTYAITPSRKLTAALDADLQKLPVSAEQANLGALQRETFKSLSTLLTPRKDQVERLLTEATRYNQERTAAKEWAVSYDDEIEAHAEAAEDFEKAQLVAEIGIVIASIALLLNSRKLWIVALCGLVGCLVVAGVTYVHTHSALSSAEKEIDEAHERYSELRETKDASGKRAADARDEETLNLVRERFGIEAPAPTKKE